MTKEEARKILIPAVGELDGIQKDLAKLVSAIQLCLNGDVSITATEESKRVLGLLVEGQKTTKVLREALKKRLNARVKES